MSSRSLLAWVALVAGAELAVRGHLADRAWLCHGGAALFALALAALAWARAPRMAWTAALGGLALVGADATWARLALGGADAAWARLAPPEPTTRAAPAPFPAPASWLRDHFDCPGAVALLDVAEPPERWETALADEPSLALVAAGPALLGALLEEWPALRVESGRLPGPRASPLGAAIERRWRRARAERAWQLAAEAPVIADPLGSAVAARYRAALLRARRAGAEVLVLIPAEAAGPPEPEARRLRLAQRALAHVARATAGAYGVRALDLAADRASLEERLAGPDAGCAPRPATPTGTPGPDRQSSRPGGNSSRIGSTAPTSRSGST